MNRELNLIAIDRENIIWKQNHSSGGTSVVQKVPECLTHGGCCETPPPPPPRGSAAPSKCGAANGEAAPGSPTSTRSVHPILDPHELMNCRLEQLAAIQAEMSEFARLVEARNNLCRQTELCRSLLENGQTLSEGQQRLDQVVQRREQLAAELNAQQLRLAAAGREMESLDDRLAAALNAEFDKRSAALDKSEKLLAALTRVAEEALQPLVSSEKRGNVGPCDRGAIVGSSSVQGSANAFVAGREPKRVDVPLGSTYECRGHAHAVCHDSGLSCCGTSRLSCSGTHGSGSAHQARGTRIAARQSTEVWQAVLERPHWRRP